MYNFANLNLTQGQTVSVTTEKGLFIGKFINISLRGLRLNLKEVKPLGQACTIPIKFFFQKDVIEVKVPNERNLKEETTPSSSDEQTQPSQFSQQQLRQIEDTIKNYTFIDQPDARYKEALIDISKQYVIGVMAEGANHGR